MKAVFELWVSSFEGTHTQLYKLKGSEIPETGLYQTKTVYFQNHTSYYNTPLYHVWYKGRRITTTLSYSEAVTVFENIIKEQGDTA